MSRIYIGSASRNRQAALDLAGALTRDGASVVSTWHDQAYDRAGEHTLSKVTQDEIVRRCLAEIDASDVVAMLGHPEMRGALVEFGYAIGKGKRVVWLGDRSVSMFSVLAGVSL